MTADDRPLWDPAMQAATAEAASKRARDGLEQAWQRVWEQPIPYYRAKYEAAGLKANEVPPLAAIPRTTKAELRADEAANPPWGTHRAVSLERAVRIGVSGGTTGRPTTFFYGPADLDAHIAIVTRNMWRHGLRAGMRFTHSWPQGLYPSSLGGGRSYLELGVLEIAVGLPIDESTAADHVSLWKLLRPDGFMMTGSQLTLYERAAARTGVDLRELLEGRLLAFLEASCQFDRPRQRVEDTYGVRLRNIGGTSDVPGFAASDCEHHRGLHIAGDHFVVQVCDPATGDEVAPGERGTLAITAFGLDAVAIRYDVEDLVAQHAGPCPCGETGPRYTLLGRRADAAFIEGQAVLPLDVELVLEDLGAPEFVLVPGESDGLLRLRIESTDQSDRWNRELSERLGVPVAVQLVGEGTLPRPVFKPRRVGH